MDEGLLNPLHRFLDGRLGVYVGDLTDHATDAIVNAANASLLGGGGVDGAIHRRGGEALTAACRQLRQTICPQGLPAGQAVMTTGGKLPAKWVIHTVGPIYGQQEGREPELLAACYHSALLLAREHGLKSIAFPAISTGIYGYPPAAAAKVVGRALCDFLAQDLHFEEIRLVFFSQKDLQQFLANWQSG